MAEGNLDVLVICGSLRKASYNAALARSLPRFVPPAMKLRYAPPFGGFPLYNADVQEAAGFPAEVTALADAIRAADGVMFVSPEYNWSIPGALKNAIDWLSRLKEQPFEDKPVAVQSAARGMMGGARMQYHLRQSLTALDVLWFGRPEVIVNFAPKKFDETTLELTDQATTDMIKAQLAAFDAFIRKVSGK